MSTKTKEKTKVVKDYSNQELIKIHQQQRDELIKQIKSASADSQIFKENTNLQNKSSGDYGAFGALETGGFIWWGMNCDLSMTSPRDFGVPTARINGSGVGFFIGGVVTTVVGGFEVSSFELPKKCKFEVGTVAGAAGVCVLTIYSEKGKFLGMFTGPAAGLGIGKSSGHGTIDV
ncbi:hypothetical protein [Aquimarina sp. 2201CG5-10]|uniref:hypothetical protein n=1 Tax=Aquimarina callyspongiae TaxID=3098150 RepID=UPI002AB3ECBD|nr:hypothetical protein [Aquimarina sp. 2201CG5-10]MDY8138416.1 hypothetical protein [Aquimarina sp. 2201CG5-10]